VSLEPWGKSRADTVAAFVLLCFASGFISCSVCGKKEDENVARVLPLWTEEPVMHTVTRGPEPSCQAALPQDQAPTYSLPYVVTPPDRQIWAQVLSLQSLQTNPKQNICSHPNPWHAHPSPEHPLHQLGHHGRTWI
jgi:hypothetical protein